jgi:hypothetical protein
MELNGATALTALNTARIFRQSFKTDAGAAYPIPPYFRNKRKKCLTGVTTWAK